MRRRAAAKQVSVERTFAEDVAEIAALQDKMQDLCQSCWRRLARASSDQPLPGDLPADRIGRTVTVKLKHSDFTLRTRSQTVAEGVTSLSQLTDQAQELLVPLMLTQPRIRLLGVGVSNWLADDAMTANEQHHEVESSGVTTTLSSGLIPLNFH